VSIHAPGRRSGGQVTLPHRDPTQSLVAIGDAQLVAAAIVSGRVVDADGIPVAGANVQLSRASGASVQHNRATTDANGCYVVAAPLESGDLLVAATHMGVGRAQAECTLAPGSETTLPDLRLQASSTLRARVVFADGEPAPHVGTGIYQPGDDSHTVSMARTDDDGRLVVRTLPPGRYTVRLSSFGGGSCPSTTLATDEDRRRSCSATCTCCASRSATKPAARCGPWTLRWESGRGATRPPPRSRPEPLGRGTARTATRPPSVRSAASSSRAAPGSVSKPTTTTRAPR
jgi:5-hydroxyisourate hydrolase-like protein (transthyretin family)